MVLTLKIRVLRTFPDFTSHDVQLIWDAESEEHYFEYTKGSSRHKVYYPTLKVRILARPIWRAFMFEAGRSIVLPKKDLTN